MVRLGEVDFTRADESQAFDYEVEGIQVHEGYALPAKYNDIAIITLKYPVRWRSYIDDDNNNNNNNNNSSSSSSSSSIIIKNVM